MQTAAVVVVEDIGPWVRFPDTLHEGYAHLAEVMGKIIHNSTSLGQLRGYH
jgi:hypothetical protein